MTHLVQRLAAFCLAAYTVCAAHADPAQEASIFSLPSPHQAYAPAESAVPVHATRLDGYQPGANGDALDGLQQDVDRCLASHDAALKLQRPAIWPAYRHGRRVDEYLAANRSIEYISTVSYEVDPNTCGLHAVVARTARLFSRNGLCQIDLQARTMRGMCDASGHADAPPPKPRKLEASAPGPSGDPMLMSMSAQMDKLLALLPVKTEQHRTVLGLDCSVWMSKASGATTCYTSAGSFVPARAVAANGNTGVLLEAVTEEGYRMTAVNVQFDTTVSNAVFTPYADGYTLVRRGK